jgi:peptidoglycan/xylan/chitin deacetylase (PgdA/CDA1 family)
MLSTRVESGLGMRKTLKRIIRRAGVNGERVAALRMCCERHVLATVPRSSTRNVGRILCYHSVGQPAWGVNDVDPKNFRRHLEAAQRAGFRFVPAAEIAATGGGPKELAITFDDGLSSVLTTAAPILADYKIPWSLFVVSGWCDQRDAWVGQHTLGWREIEKALALGAELGSHSQTHPDFARIGESQAVDELGESRRTIRARLGIDTRTFAIPFGQSLNWPAHASRAAVAAGYEVIYAQAEETRPPGTVARTFVTRYDGDRIFKSLLRGAFDRWEEWLWPART